MEFTMAHAISRRHSLLLGASSGVALASLFNRASFATEAASAEDIKEHLEAAAGILAVEAYHMGMARSQLYEMGEEAWKAANALSEARDKVDGPEDKDQGIRVNGKANFVPSNDDGIAFR